MSRFYYIRCIFILVALQLAFTGCSNGKGLPVVPDTSSNFPKFNTLEQANHKLWGLWEMSYDPSREMIEVSQVRNTEVHLEITDFLLQFDDPKCITVVLNSYDPLTGTMDIDIILKNPTDMVALDVRGIIYTDDSGTILTNPSAWTHLFDIPGGRDINPFRAYARGSDQWQFHPGAVHSENYIIHLNDPAQPGNILFAVETSFPGYCQEPFMLVNINTSTIRADDEPGKKYYLNLRVIDHQDDISSVTAYCEDLFGPEPVVLNPLEGGNGNWRKSFSKLDQIPIGEYEILIEAKSGANGNAALYNTHNVFVFPSATLIDPEDHVPSHIVQHFYRDISTSDGYLYICRRMDGYVDLNILDISDPDNLVFIKSLDHIQPASDSTKINLVIHDGRAYLLTLGKLSVIDITSPENAYLLPENDLSFYEWSKLLAVNNGYAYIQSSAELMVVDIDPLESAEIVNSVDLHADFLIIDGDKGYCGFGNYGTQVEFLDLTDPVFLSVSESLDVPGYLTGLAFNNGYLYAAYQKPESDWTEDIAIIETGPPGESSITGNIHLNEKGVDLKMMVDSNCLAVFDVHNVRLYDVTDPNSPHMILSEYSDFIMSDISLHAGHAYVASRYNMQSYSYLPFDGLQLAGAFPTIYSLENAVTDGEYIIGISDDDLCVLQVDQGEISHIVSRTPMDYQLYSWVLDQGLLYISCRLDILPVPTGRGLLILDITKPKKPQVKSFISTGHQADHLYVRGDFVYMAGKNFGLHVVDAGDPIAPSIAGVLETDQNYFTGLTANDLYVYLLGRDVNNNYTLHTIYVSPDGQPWIIDSLEIKDRPKSALYNIGGILLFSTDSGELKTIDVSVAHLPHIAGSIPLPFDATLKGVKGNYALISYNYEFFLIDVESPTELSYWAAYRYYGITYSDFFTLGNHILISSSGYPLRMFDFW